MKSVHLAAGEHASKFPGWLNVDGFAGPHIDLVVDLITPGWSKTIEEQWGRPDLAYIGHFLEHMTPEEASEFVRELHGWLTPGGKAVFVGPDVPKARLLAQQRRIPQSLLEACEAHGEINPENPTDRCAVHAWNTSGSAVVDLLHEAGWDFAIEHGISPWPMRDVPCISDAVWQYLVISHSNERNGNA
jgi:hypothetical protein